MKEVTVNKAIKKGHRIVNYPLYGWMIIGFGLTLYLMTYLKNVWTFPIGFILTFIMMCLWWSITITKWRIWAFTNCRNVHELKRKAINQKLIWPDGSWFEKTEIRTNRQKIELEKIALKFRFDDIPEKLKDDKTIPFETKIYHSKAIKIYYIILIVGLGVFGFYGVINNDWYGYFVIIISIVIYYEMVSKYSNKEAQIIINEEGIKTIETEFITWDSVKNISVELQGYGKHAKWYLDIDFKVKDNQGNWGDRIDISDFDTSVRKIEWIIKIYQQRNRQR